MRGILTVVDDGAGDALAAEAAVDLFLRVLDELDICFGTIKESDEVLAGVSEYASEIAAPLDFFVEEEVAPFLPIFEATLGAAAADFFEEASALGTAFVGVVFFTAVFTDADLVPAFAGSAFFIGAFVAVVEADFAATFTCGLTFVLALVLALLRAFAGMTFFVGVFNVVFALVVFALAFAVALAVVFVVGFADDFAVVFVVTFFAGAFADGFAAAFAGAFFAVAFVAALTGFLGAIFAIKGTPELSAIAEKVLSSDCEKTRYAARTMKNIILLPESKLFVSLVLYPLNIDGNAVLVEIYCGFERR